MFLPSWFFLESKLFSESLCSKLAKHSVSQSRFACTPLPDQVTEITPDMRTYFRLTIYSKYHDLRKETNLTYHWMNLAKGLGGWQQVKKKYVLQEKNNCWRHAGYSVRSPFLTSNHACLNWRNFVFSDFLNLNIRGGPSYTRLILPLPALCSVHAPIGTWYLSNWGLIREKFPLGHGTNIRCNWKIVIFDVTR